jgi:hypothetical protein
VTELLFPLALLQKVLLLRDFKEDVYYTVSYSFQVNKALSDELFCTEGTALYLESGLIVLSAPTAAFLRPL